MNGGIMFDKINAGCQIADIKCELVCVVVRNKFYNLKLLVEDLNLTGFVVIPLQCYFICCRIRVNQ